MLVDSHCHIPLIAETQGAGQPADIVDRAVTAGVEHMLCVGVDVDSFPGVRAVAETFPNVFGSVGVHPNTPADSADVDVDALTALAASDRIVAIGETGLDYYRDDVPIERQHARFRTHIRAAREIGKPLIIHCRDAGDDLVRVLAEEGAGEVGGVMHCFVDSYEIATRAMDLNFAISFSGIVTFKSAGAVRDVARQVPLERMLVETDSPWLAPVPHRGRTNEPAYVAHVAACIAALKETTVEAVARVTTDNFFGLFRAATPVTAGPADETGTARQ